MKSKRIRINIDQEIGSVSGLLLLPKTFHCVLVLSHGAGAGMEHTFMEKLVQNLALNKIGTLRFNFPHMEKGGGPPDRPKKAFPAILSAIKKAQKFADGKLLLVGGKSFGGRMTSQLAALDELHEVRGIVYYGFPLHPPGKPSVKRAEHLQDVQFPQLFLQGTRDKLAELELIQSVCKSLDLANLVILEGADHSFKTLKSSGISQEEMIAKLAAETAKFALDI